MVHAFGDSTVEVPRLELSLDALEGPLRRERQDRLAAAEQMSALGQAGRALILREEARIIETYIAPRQAIAAALAQACAGGRTDEEEP